MAYTRKILLVDDERELIETVRPFLEARGYQVVIAYNGREALEKVKDSPDLILLDIMMPGLDGLEVLRRLRNDDSTSKIPIIMLTAKSETKSLFDAQDLEATDYIIKPFSLDDLYTQIGRYLDEDKRRPVKI